MTLTGPAPSNGVIAYITCDQAAANAPSSLTFQPGESAKSFTTTSSIVTETTIANLVASAIGGSSAAALTLYVIPTAINQSLANDFGNTLAITLTGNDANTPPLPLNYTVTGGPFDGPPVTGTPPNIYYTPNTGYLGADYITFTVNNGYATSQQATISISTLIGAPLATSQSVTTDEDVPVDITLAADPNNPPFPLTLTLLSLPVNGTLSGITPDITYTPIAGYYGTDSFSYLVNNGTYDSAEATVSITVNQVNYPPVANDQQVNTNEGTPVAIQLTASSENGLPLSYSYTQPSNGGIVTDNGTAGSGSVLYTSPSLSFCGMDSFTFTANDGNNDSNTATVTVVVADAPIANDAFAEVTRDSHNNLPIDVISNDYDMNGATLSVVSVGTPGNGTAYLNDGLITYTPAPEFSGCDQFSYTITDTMGAIASAMVYVIVDDSSGFAMQDATAIVQINSNLNPVNAITLDQCNPDAGAALFLTGISEPTNGTLTWSGNSLYYTPKDGFSGTDSFSYTVNDGLSQDQQANVSLIISNPNISPPSASDVVLTVSENSSANDVDLSSAISDANGYQLTVIAVGNAAIGTATLANGQVSYTPAPDFAGTDAFTYTITDGVGGMATANVNVTVTPLPPVANNAIAILGDGNSVTINVLANDIDPNGYPLTVLNCKKGNDGNVVLNADNTLTYTTTDPNFVTDTFTYSATNGQNTSNIAQVTVLGPNAASAVTNPLLVSPASPVTSCSVVQLTANFQDETDELYWFRAGYQTDTNAWVWFDLMPYSLGKTCLWTPCYSGTYCLALFKRGVNSSNDYDSSYFISSYQVNDLPASTTPPPISAITLNSPGAPVALGSTVTLSASATGGQNPVYKFKLGYEDGNGWHWIDLCDYSNNNTISWQPSVSPGVSGRYILAAMARENTDSENYAAFNAVPITVASNVTGVQLSTSTVTQTEESAVTLTATPTVATGDSSTTEIAFRVGNVDGSNNWQWNQLNDYSTNATINWTPPYSGNYELECWARDAGSPASYQQYAALQFTATPALVGVTLTATCTVPQSINQVYTLKANSTLVASVNVEYQFRLGMPDGNGGMNWSVIQDYSQTNSTHWIPNALGTYTLVVWAREVGHTNNYDEQDSQIINILFLPPIADSQSLTCNENQQLLIQLSAKDQNGIPLTFSLVNANGLSQLGGTVTFFGATTTQAIANSQSYQQVYYTPPLNYSGGFDIFQFNVADDYGNLVLGTVLIYVKPICPQPDVSILDVVGINQAGDVPLRENSTGYCYQVCFPKVTPPYTLYYQGPDFNWYEITPETSLPNQVQYFERTVSGSVNSYYNLSIDYCDLIDLIDYSGEVYEEYNCDFILENPFYSNSPESQGVFELFLDTQQ